jgi:hypothetical protein
MCRSSYAVLCCMGQWFLHMYLYPYNFFSMNSCSPFCPKAYFHTRQIIRCYSMLVCMHICLFIFSMNGFWLLLRLCFVILHHYSTLMYKILHCYGFLYSASGVLFCRVATYQLQVSACFDPVQPGHFGSWLPLPPPVSYSLFYSLLLVLC